MEAFALDRRKATDGHRGKDAVLDAALAKRKRRVAVVEVLHRVVFSAVTETRQQIHAVERDNRICNVRLC